MKFDRMCLIITFAQQSNKNEGAKWCPHFPPPPVRDVWMSFGGNFPAEMLQILRYLRVIGLKTWPQIFQKFFEVILKKLNPKDPQGPSNGGVWDISRKPHQT